MTNITFKTYVDFLGLEWDVEITYNPLNVEVEDYNVMLGDYDANEVNGSLDLEALNSWYELLDFAMRKHIGAEPDWRAE